LRAATIKEGWFYISVALQTGRSLADHARYSAFYERRPEIAIIVTHPES
jgi:hypothetical protein